MISYPTPSAYQEALQFPRTAFVDPVWQEAEPEAALFGLPKVITGAFAAVFPIRLRDERWAIKCFLTDVSDQHARYAAIRQHLATVDVPYIVGFDYQTTGLRVQEATYPMVALRWVEGMALHRFVEQHLNEPDVLGALVEAWRHMMQALREAQVAHGDLQHGNVLVQLVNGHPQLRLVDYDTMYVPALAGRKSAEVGHRNYQHPNRDERDFGLHLDHFSALAIYVALRVCQVRPALWGIYTTDENLLFRAADFYDPASSALFAELRRIPEVAVLVRRLETACYLAPEAIPPLETILTDPERLSAAEQVEAALERAKRTVHEDRRARTTTERYALIGLLAGIVGGSGVALGISVAVGSGVLLITLLSVLAFAYHQHRRLPTVRRARRLQREMAYFDALVEQLRRQVDALEAERRQVQQRLETLRAERLAELRHEALAERLKYHFIAEAIAYEGIHHKVILRLKASAIRTALHVTPERIQAIVQMEPDTKAAVLAWRDTLVAQYAADLPERLSPAEERRLKRYVQQRAGSLHAEIERTRERIHVQHVERTHLAQRLRALPRLTFGRYLGYLLYLATWPQAVSATSGSVAQMEARAEPIAIPEEDAWWKRG